MNVARQIFCPVLPKSLPRFSVTTHRFVGERVDEAVVIWLPIQKVTTSNFKLQPMPSPIILDDFFIFFSVLLCVYLLVNDPKQCTKKMYIKE